VKTRKVALGPKLSLDKNPGMIFYSFELDLFEKAICAIQGHTYSNFFWKKYVFFWNFFSDFFLLGKIPTLFF